MTRLAFLARTCTACALALSLLACASNAPRTALEQGQALAATGRLAEAYQELDAASRQNPGDDSLRAASMQTRERLAASLLRRGDEATAAGRLEEARNAYAQLGQLPGHAGRANEALAKLEQKQIASLPELPDSWKAPQQLVGERIAAPARTARGIPAIEPPEALGRQVSLEFRDAAIRSVFEAITRASGLNVVFDRDVSQDMRTTIYLRNTRIKAALDKIAMISGLALRLLDEHTLLIYTDEVGKQRDYQQLVVHSFHLASADARTVANSLRTVLRFRDMVVDEKLNMIVVRDTPEAIALAEKLVAMHDVAEPEVMLEVEIIEIKRGLLQDLGVQWPGGMTLTPLGSGTRTTTDSSGNTITQLTLRDMLGLTPGSLGVSIDSLAIKAQRTDSGINLLANPRIRARNREKAKILIGERVPNISSTATSTGFVSENITYVEVGLKLDVEPQIFPNGEVAIKLGLEVSSINESVSTSGGTVAYRIGTRNANTSLRLRDGETQVLGGLIQDNDRKTVTKVPLLGDIPVLGRLFTMNGDDTSKTEIVLSITPRIVRGIEPLSGERSSFEAGTASGVRGRRPDTDYAEDNGMPGTQESVERNGGNASRNNGSGGERRERDEN